MKPFIAGTMTKDEAKFSSRFAGEIPTLCQQRRREQNLAFCVSANRTPHDSSGPQVGPLGAKPLHGMPPVHRRAGANPTNPWDWLYVEVRGLEQSSIDIPLAGINPLLSRSWVRGGFWINKPITERGKT